MKIMNWNSAQLLFFFSKTRFLVLGESEKDGDTVKKGEDETEEKETWKNEISEEDTSNIDETFQKSRKSENEVNVVQVGKDMAAAIPNDRNQIGEDAPTR